MVDTSHPAVERIESTVMVLVQIIDNHDKSNETEIENKKRKEKKRKRDIKQL